MDTATAIARAVHGRTRFARSVVEEALARIDALDSRIQAWVHLDPEGAFHCADALDGRVMDDAAGPLAGVPVGIKDIFDVAGMPTRAGAPRFAHTMPDTDAPAVTRLHEAGAIILGKTVTTTFAFFDPGETRNPWNLAHTPGGSSSGSAAAVAAGMVPVALGTQTVGSVLRPAAYCGIAGFKPGHGIINTAGVVPLSWSLDHVGIFARSVEDIECVFGVLAAYELPEAMAPERPHIGIPRAFFTERASPEINANLDAVAQKLREAGAVTLDVPFPTTDDWSAAGQPVLAAEAAAFHARWFDANAEAYSPALRALVERGRALPATAYVDANRARAALRGGLAHTLMQAREPLGPLDALLLPTAPTTAPEGLGSTGDPAFCAPASFAGLPAISLPSGLGEKGLPLAVQFVAAPGGEAALLALARWVEGLLGFDATPA